MGPTETPWDVVAALALAGLAAGAAAAEVSRRLAQEPASRPVQARHVLLPAIGSLVGVWAALGQASVLEAGLTALLGWQLLWIAVVDAEHFWLPDWLTLPLALSGLATAALLENWTLANAIAGAAAGFLLLWLLARAYRWLRGREGLGGGDPFLLAGLGAWTGWIGLPSVLLWSSLAGLSVVLAQVMAGQKVSGTDRLPFGVFLAIGGWLTWMLGPLGV